MNESDRQELERLKQQQIALGAKLAELSDLSSELALLNLKISALEERLKTPEPPSLPAKLLAQREEREVVQPKVEEKPVPPVLQPPPPPQPKPAQAKPSPSPALQPEAEEPAPYWEEELPIAPPFSPPPVSTPTLPPAPPPPLPPPSPRPKPEKAPFELRLGTYWLVRVGIVMVLTGLVFLANYAYKNWIMDMGPASKVGLLYFAGALLLGVGGFLYRKFEPLKNYAQVLVAGGLAEVYFTTYAAHHLHFLRIIQSPLLDAFLLLIWAGIIVAIADWKKSEIMALLAIVLSYYDAVITRVGLFTLYSNLILAVAALVFLVRNRWAATSLASLVATYGGYAFWRFFGPQGWHWATPEEGLWTGAWFLISYWAIFTAAVFLCRQWPLTPTDTKAQAQPRTGFLSLNNGAFFGLFVLTMLQVHHGGFWKVALIFGLVLIAMAVLSRVFLPAEPLTSNGYLTQGIFLVTLGFITKFSGPDLALVLALESALLQVMSRQLRNQVLRFGSIICAALTTGCAVGSIQDFNTRGLIVGAAAGFFMIFSSWWTRRLAGRAVPGTPPLDNSTHAESIYFTVLGLLIWALTTWRNTRPEWLGLTLGAESVLFLLASRWLPLLRFGSYVYAALAMAFSVHFLFDQLEITPQSQRIGLTAHAILGLLMIFNALWERRSLPADTTFRQPGPDWLFSGLGLVVWLVTTCTFTPSRWLAPALAFETVLFTLQLIWLRLPPVAILGQLFLVIAQFQSAVLLMQQTPPVAWLHDTYAQQLAKEALGTAAGVPWWNPAIVIAITVLLSHWWQRSSVKTDKSAPTAFPPELRQICQVLYALALVGVLFCWLRFYFSPPVWLAFTCVLAGALTAYGLFTRLWLIAAFGQLFLVVSLFEFLRQVLGHGFPETSPKLFALAPIAALWALSLAVLWWFERNPAQGRLADNLKWVGTGYRTIAVLLAVGWIFEYISAANRFWVFALLGAVFFLWRLWKPRTEPLIISAVFTLIGFAQYWAVFHSPEKVVYWPNLLCILALFAQQQLARRKIRLPEPAHTAIILIGGCSLWLYAGQLVKWHSGGTGFFLTATWAAVALVIFNTGFLLRERVYRWLGLGILAVALARVMLVDVWQLETAYRILSFMALGVVLLVLGFIYTKYQEKIRQWL